MLRLNRYLAMAGAASRRKADILITESRVSVNGRIVTDLGVKIDPSTDRIFLNGRELAPPEAPVYLVLNKPKDCITTVQDERGRATVLNLVRVPQRIFPVGRLDRNTTGVLILTNDGELAALLMHPSGGVKKVYRASLTTPIGKAEAYRLAKGVSLSDGTTAPADVTLEDESTVILALSEGRNRQVHRMIEAVGSGIRALDRLAYGPVTTKGLRRGEWRRLTRKEIEALRPQKRPMG